MGVLCRSQALVKQASHGIGGEETGGAVLKNEGGWYKEIRKSETWKACISPQFSGLQGRSSPPDFLPSTLPIFHAKVKPQKLHNPLPVGRLLWAAYLS